MRKIYLIILLLSFFVINSFAKENVAKVIILRGKVIAKAKDSGNVQVLKKGMWLSAGTIVKTSKRSFVKLLFIDKSQLSLGPKSEMVIKQFPKNKPGVIDLLSGKLRSKVTKNYMEIKDKEGSKLYIQTRTAALGVRGTDFQVGFYPESNKTTLITFSGAVAMAKFNNIKVGTTEINTKKLEKVLRSKTAVVVRKGEFSNVAPDRPSPAKPVKISPEQLQLLKTDPSIVKNKGSKSKKGSEKLFRSPIPPGMDKAYFENNEGSIDKKFEDIADIKAIEIKNENSSLKDGIKEHKEIVQTGGFVDLKTGDYIPPDVGKYNPAYFQQQAIAVGAAFFETGKELYREPASIDGRYNPTILDPKQLFDPQNPVQNTFSPIDNPETKDPYYDSTSFEDGNKLNYNNMDSGNSLPPLPGDSGGPSISTQNKPVKIKITVE